ncbi:site-specific DNA-methyltransferase [Bacillus sp. AG4(2022)]|uniref:DNA-methyltransferase n=1 Tax=Bacillus sp. AG4(2022) TaxID=2962594 RepID=UPI0028819198|nr:site-specific DNA-methyltransferase [Bacillus sp. AG4(2022)]MDT0160447.1 site-specific DNA-methyltransferase [Bacillus sp. AG4(2022)]
MEKDLMQSIEFNKIYNEDCLGDETSGTGMWRLPDKSVDMILCDLPYGTTRNKWDSIIPLKPLWEHYERIIKDKGAIVLTSAEPFTSMLVTSNLKMFRYDIIWEKQKGSDPLNANRKPLRAHENILIFYKKLPIYNPQFEYGEPYIRKGDCTVKSSNFNKASTVKDLGSKDGKRYPKTVIKFSNEGMNAKNFHPTQKPVKLFEWLIKTYTNENDIVLDNCIGSGTTAVASILNKRKFIGFETEKEYIEVANKRIKEIKVDAY